MTAQQGRPVAAAPGAPRIELTAEERRRLARRIAATLLENEERAETNRSLEPMPSAASIRLGKKEALGEEEIEPGGKLPASAATPVSADDEADGRVRARVALWRLHTTVDVELNAQTGELWAWRNARPQKERGEKQIWSYQAIERAGQVLDLPPDCGDADALLRQGTGVPYYEVQWVHLTGPDGDVVVEGDKIIARVNATTGKVQSIFRRWRKVPPTPPA